MKRKQPEDVVWAADTVGIVKFRLTVLQRLLTACSLPVGYLLGWATLWIAGEPASLGFELHFLAGGLVGGLVVMFTPPNFSITLSPHMAQVRNARRRTICWSDVQVIRIEKRSFGRRTIVIYEATGRKTELRAPVTGPFLWDRRFDEKFHVIGQWWLDFRGAEWQPGFEPWSPRPIREAARRNAGRLR